MCIKFYRSEKCNTVESLISCPQSEFTASAVAYQDWPIGDIGMALA